MFTFTKKRKQELPTADEALPGRPKPMVVPPRHAVLDTPLEPPFPEGTERLVVGMGCFWGAERLYWTQPGVFTTAVGYAGGLTPNPTYEEVCTGLTGHAEVVLVVYRPAEVGVEELLARFWEGHDPTQGMRQGADVGTQYRSVIFSETAGQLAAAEATREAYQGELTAAGRGRITTEVAMAPEFSYAEGAHQQYLAKNPGGYCGLGSTGVSCPRLG